MRWALVFCLLLLALPAHGTTRLGLHVTTEERACWRQRAGIDSPGTGGVTCTPAYNTVGDVQTNSPGDWARITSNKEAFRSNTTLGCWSGPTGCSQEPSWDTSGCTTNAEWGNAGSNAANFPGFNSVGFGDEVRDAAFFAMVHPEHASASDAATKVRTFLLNHAGAGKLNWTNKSLMCEGVVTGDGNPRFEWATWMMKLLFAYEYLQIYGNMTAGDQTTLDAWFLGAGQFVRGMTFGASPFTSSNFNNTFPNHESEYPTTVALGSKFTSNLGSGFNACPMPGTQMSMYDGSPLVSDTFSICTNRGMQTNALTMNVGVKFNNTELIRHAKEWIQVCLVYGVWGNGDDSENIRVADNGFDDEDHGHQYQGFKMGSVIDSADVLARSGDLSLYTYSTSDGVCQINASNTGGPKTVELWLTTYAKYIDHQILRYKPSAAHTTINEIDTIYHNGGAGQCGRFWEVYSLPRANHYYQNAYWKQMYLRQNGGGPITPPAYPSAATQCGGQGYLWGGQWSTLSGSLFMFGNTEHIDVYNIGTTAVAPTIGITQPTTGSTYATTATTLTTLQGTAGDDVGVTSVTWACPTCTPTSGTATCGTCGASATAVTWSVASIGLAAGVNQLTVTASDGTLTGTATLRVLRGTPDLTSNKILHLPFEEGGGTTADDIGTGNNDATLSAGVTWSTGRVGAYAVGFTDNSGHLVSVSGTTAYATTAAAFTVALWTNLSAFTVALDYPIPLHLRSNGSLTFEIDYSNDATNNCLGVSFGNTGGGFTPVRYLVAAAADLLGWHHLAIVYNGSGATTAANYTLYWDGAPQTLTTSACPAGKAQATTLGGYAGDTQFEDWQGDLDDVYVFSRALSAVDVYGLYLLTPTAPTVGGAAFRLLR